MSYPSKKIRKRGPFTLPKIREDFPGLAQLIAPLIAQIDELPDFSDDSKIGIMTDFGGEHDGAVVNTYSFLIYAQSKMGPFEDATKELRCRHGLLDPFCEFQYKKLKNGPRMRAIPGFLDIVDSLIHGVLVTLVVDKSIKSVFGDKGPAAVATQLAANGFREWKPSVAEKMMRVCHTAAAFLSVLTSPGQRLLWYCDEDAINKRGPHQPKSETLRLFATTLGMYSPHTFDLIGGGVSFTDKSYLDDFLSVPDLAAGAVCDLMTAHIRGHDSIAGEEGKKVVLQWIARPAPFLSKVTLQVARLPDGSIGSGLVAIEPASPLPA